MKYKVYIGMNKLIIDFCAFVNGGKSAIAEIIFGNLTKYGNALKKCPVSVRMLIICSKCNFKNT